MVKEALAVLGIAFSSIARMLRNAKFRSHARIMVAKFAVRIHHES